MSAYPCPCNVTDLGLPTSVMRAMREECTAHETPELNYRNVILVGDVLARLADLPDESVHCVVTSPPYWGLRDYGADGQIGMEATPEEYVENMVAVFREVRRVLRKNGTCWLNLGDSYAGSWGNYGGQNRGNGSQREIANGSKAHQASYDGLESWRPPTSSPPGLKPKDLVGIPWHVAFALQADGWWLRSDIIWSKPNPMPESVTDRPTKAHEYVFLLTKSATYYYDAEAIKEPAHDWGERDRTNFRGGTTDPLLKHHGFTNGNQASTGRNKRTVWEIATAPFPGAHFATFPPDLVKPCILAGTSEHGVCSDCGAPWHRVVERQAMVIDRSDRTHELGRTRSSGTMVEAPQSRTTGWQPSCQHDAPLARALVLDPFIGSGTTAIVARNAGRDYVGIELNPEYAAMASERLQQKALL